MKEQLIQEVQRQMLPYLNNAQLKQLQGVLEGGTEWRRAKSQRGHGRKRKGRYGCLFYQRKTH